MTTFAEVLGRWMRAEAVRPRAASFEDAVSAFDAHVAGALSVEPSVDLGAAWAAELGVSPRCSCEDLRRAFRRRAFETHPDRPGGSPEAFMRVRARFEEATAALALHQATSPAPAASFAAPVSSYVRMSAAPSRAPLTTRAVLA